MITNVQTIPMTGRAVTWDGTNIEEIREVAGDAFLGVNTTHVLVSTGEGMDPIWVQTGWTVVRFGDKTQVFSPGAAEFSLRAVQDDGGSVA